MSTTSSSSSQASLVEAAYENFPTSAAILDSDGVIVDVNRTWRVFGASNGAPEGATNVGDNYLAVCDAIPPDDPEHDDATAVAAGLREILAEERDLFTYEYECSSPDTPRWFVMQATPFDYDEVSYVLVIHSDITDRKLSEVAISAVNERLSTITALLSAEMSTTASLAVGRLSLLESEVESEHLEPLKTSLKSLQDDVTQLLTIVRGEVKPGSDELDLEAYARDVWERTLTHDATLDIEGTTTIRADADRIDRILTHLYRVAVLRADGEGDISLAPTSDGFVVEHAWPGVPEGIDPRAAESGDRYLDADLSIVQLLAASEGWLFDVTLEDDVARYRVAGAEVFP